MEISGMRGSSNITGKDGRLWVNFSHHMKIHSPRRIESQQILLQFLEDQQGSSLYN